jgi:hypothetical protein
MIGFSLAYFRYLMALSRKARYFENLSSESTMSVVMMGMLGNGTMSELGMGSV